MLEKIRHSHSCNNIILIYQIDGILCAQTLRVVTRQRNISVDFTVTVGRDEIQFYFFIIFIVMSK